MAKFDDDDDNSDNMDNVSTTKAMMVMKVIIVILQVILKYRAILAKLTPPQRVYALQFYPEARR